MKINKVTMLGGGLMGSGIAQIFASQGCQVAVFDTLGDKCKTRDNIRTNMLQMQKYGMCTEEDIEATVSRVSITDRIEQATVGAELVIHPITKCFVIYT